MGYLERNRRTLQILLKSQLWIVILPIASADCTGIILLLLDLFDISFIIDSKLVNTTFIALYKYKYEYIIFHSFFCSFQRLVSSLLTYIPSIKETWHFNLLKMFQNGQTHLRNLADSRFRNRFKIVCCKIFNVCVADFEFFLLLAYGNLESGLGMFVNVINWGLI